jgi:hypothetical protein
VNDAATHIAEKSRKIDDDLRKRLNFMREQLQRLQHRDGAWQPHLTLVDGEFEPLNAGEELLARLRGWLKGATAKGAK